MKPFPTLLALLITLSAPAAEPAAKPGSDADKIRITSRDGFEYDLNSRTAIYRGAVVVTDSTMKMTCESLSVQFAAATGATNATSRPMVAGNLGGRVEMIAAAGRVIIINQQDGSTAIGDKAVYTAANETVVLSGDRPSITASNGSGMRADIVIFDRRAGRFRAEGRVESFFTQSAIDGGSLFNTTTQPPAGR